MLTRSQYFSIFIVLLLLLAVLTALTPAFVNVDLFYPHREDSLFVRMEAERMQPANKKDASIMMAGLLFNPSSVNLPYEEFNITTADNLVLRGWYIRSAKADAPTLLIVHDLNESKINYLELLKQLYDRELNTCIVDLRAHGNSDGKEFSPGMSSVKDVEIMLDSLSRKKETGYVYLMGVGTGAFIATQAAAVNEHFSGLILENGFINYENFLDYYAHRKWKSFKFLFMQPFLQKVRNQIHMDPKNLDVSKLLALVHMPTLFIAGGRDDFAAASESAILKDSSAARQKELFLIRGSFHRSEAEPGDEYYNRIAEFIVLTIPPKQKKSRYKKLAFN